MALQVESLGVVYGSREKREEVHAVADVSMEVGETEFVSIIGPSGCGKSTLLHSIGGLIHPAKGRIVIDGIPVTKPDPTRATFVFQDYSLLPWRTVLDNVALGLTFAHRSKSQRHAVARQQLELVGLGDVAQAYPTELSGGMQQRVAIARALTMRAQYLLLDEPFGALDEQTRRQLGIDMTTLLTEQRTSVLMVTHSLDEAIFWADRILVMTPRPARIRSVLPIPVPRPRSIDFLSTDLFAQRRTELLGLLQ